MPRSLALFGVLAVVAGCGEVFTFDDVGDLCVVGSDLYWPGDDEDMPLVTDYEAGAPVTVTVVLEECASGCAEDIEAECDVDQDGNTLDVSASASYVVPGGKRNCPTVCVVVAARCESEPLAAGTYTVEYGGESTIFDVPDTSEPAKIGRAYCDEAID